MVNKLIKLKNGLKIILDKRKDTMSVYATLSVNVGAFFPQTQKVGIAHMLEHNICTEFAEQKLNKIGTTLEAFTYDCQTLYSVRTFKEHLENVLDTILKTVFDVKFSKAFFENEKRVIKQEYKKQRANIMAQNAFNAAESFYEETFIANTGYGIGDAKQVDDISFSDLKKFYNNYYGYNNSTITIVGNFNERAVLKLIKQLSSKYQKNAKITLKMCENDINKNNSAKINVLSSGNNDSCCVELLFSAVNKNSCKFYVYQCISYMLCGMFSNAVIRDRLRNKLGLVYGCDSDVDASIPYKDCGTLSVRYYVAKENVEHSIYEAFDAVLLLKKEKNQAVLDVAKICLVNDIKIKCENMFAYSRLQSEYVALAGKLFNVNEIEKYIESISYDMVLTELKTMLSKKCVVSVLGVKVDSREIKNILKKLIQKVI